MMIGNFILCKCNMFVFLQRLTNTNWGPTSTRQGMYWLWTTRASQVCLKFLYNGYLVKLKSFKTIKVSSLHVCFDTGKALRLIWIYQNKLLVELIINLGWFQLTQFLLSPQCFQLFSLIIHVPLFVEIFNI